MMKNTKKLVKGVLLLALKVARLTKAQKGKTKVRAALLKEKVRVAKLRARQPTRQTSPLLTLLARAPTVVVGSTGRTLALQSLR